MNNIVDSKTGKNFEIKYVLLTLLIELKSVL